MDIVPPESQGFSRPRLARIRTVMQRYVDERKLAGIVSLIARRGEVVHFDLGKSQMPGSVGSYGWSGAANTHFWIDPKEELIAILMLQFMPIDNHPVIADFHTLTYQAMV